MLLIKLFTFCIHLFTQITYQQGLECAQTVDAIFSETSALTAQNVEKMFIEICKLTLTMCDLYQQNSTLKGQVFFVLVTVTHSVAVPLVHVVKTYF